MRDGSRPGTLRRIGIFTVARLLHSVVYLAEKQPWRTVFFFIVGGLATLALVVADALLLVQAHP